jgi:hypothetical protein
MRVYLAYHNWPLPNSDEGTMGVMAINILKYGEHPVVYYGQDYMGVLQAYLGASIFQFLGSSVFGLRLGMVILYAAFLLCIYLLTRQLYNKHFALFITLLFAFGSTAMLSRQLIAIGGYPETIFFSTASLVLSVFLALNPPKDTRRDRISRHLLFFLWGVAIGLGAWSDSLILPWVAFSGLILLFSWREIIFKGTILTIILGLLIGGLPLIIYNLGAAPGQHTITVLLSQEGHAPWTLAILTTQINNTFTTSLPIITGDPICLKSEYGFLAYWGFGQPWFQQCTYSGAIWSLGYLALWASSALLILLPLKKLLLPFKGRVWSLEERRQIVLMCLRLILLTGIMATILVYLRSQMVLYGPGVNARYLIGLWVGFPAIVWPLWQGVAHVKEYTASLTRVFLIARRALSFSFLILLLAILVYGSSLAIGQIPQADAEQVSEQNLVNTLQAQGITHIYSNYWFSYRLIFASNEHIICASFNYNYKQDHKITLQQNKYAPYLKEVQNDPYSSYAIPTNSNGELKNLVAQKFEASKMQYRIFTVSDYLIYQPIHS